MLKGSLGQFSDFLSRCEEDVVVLAHTHTWKEHEIESTKNGDIFYINTGTWIDYASDVSLAQHPIAPIQEPITRSAQLSYSHVTVFLQTGLFLGFFCREIECVRCALSRNRK